MCITIPTSANVKQARQWAAWQWLSASPLRLYLIGGGLLWAVALAAGLAGHGAQGGWFQFNLLFALLPCLLLGFVFQLMPGLLKVTPLTYVRFASLFFVLLLSQLLFHAAALRGAAPGFFYLLSLALVWGLTLLSLRGMLKLSYVPTADMAAAVFHLLLLAAALGLLIAGGLSGGWFPGLYAYAWVGLLPLYLSALLILLFLHHKFPPARGY